MLPVYYDISWSLICENLTIENKLLVAEGEAIVFLLSPKRQKSFDVVNDQRAVIGANSHVEIWPRLWLTKILRKLTNLLNTLREGETTLWYRPRMQSQIKRIEYLKELSSKFLGGGGLL